MPEEAERTARIRRRGAIASYAIALVALKLWLVSWQAVAADGSARFDDALFIELAHHLKSGDWLGPYNERTLAKGPGYPLWLALTGALGLPLLPTQHMLHALAAAASCAALRHAIPSPWARLALFGVTVFDPATFEMTSMRVTREGIYPALAMFVVAGLIEIAGWKRPRAWPAVVVTVATGLALGAFWITREEGPWVTPAIVLLSVYSLIRLGRGQIGWRRLLGAAIVAIPLVVAVCCVVTVAAINKRYYGMPTVVELKSHWFERGYGAVTRVAPENYVQWVPLPKASRLLAYEASPAFAELRPYLDSTGEDGAFSLSQFGEMTGTWFIWAFREAAAAAGHHESLLHASNYYLRVADEIDAACDAGTVPCGPPRASLAPPQRREYFSGSVRAFTKLGRITLRMEQFEIGQSSSVGGTELIAPFIDLVHMRVEGTTDATDPRGTVRQEVLRAIRDIYALLLPAMALPAFFVLLLASVLARIRCGHPHALVLAWAVMLAIVARLALLAYISASSYAIYQGLYLRVLYPLLYVFVALCAAIVVRASQRTSSSSFKS